MSRPSRRITLLAIATLSTLAASIALDVGAHAAPVYVALWIAFALPRRARSSGCAAS